MGITGCSADVEEKEEFIGDSTPITFLSNTVEKTVVTRADEGLHDAGIGSFRVWAFKNDGVSGDSYTSYQTVMNGYSVWWDTTTSSSNSNYWEYVNGQTQTIKFWDMSANAYRFCGIAPATATHSASISGTDAKSLNIMLNVDATNEASIPYYSELWYSTGNPTQFPDRQFLKAVKMRFIRPVAYVRFMFTFENPTDEATTTLTGKSFKPTDGGMIEQKGDVIISYPLTGTGTSETYSVGSQGMMGLTALTQDYYITPADANACTTYAVLPDVNQSSYILRVNVNGEPKSVVVPEQYMSWLPSYDYTYIFKVHVDGGVTIDDVQSAFTPWVPENGEHTVYNW